MKFVKSTYAKEDCVINMDLVTMVVKEGAMTRVFFSGDAPALLGESYESFIEKIKSFEGDES